MNVPIGQPPRRPRNSLADKVKFDPNLNPRAMFARAERELAALKADFTSIIGPQTELMTKTMAEIITRPQASRVPLAALFDLSFEIKGQAGTMGYPLVSEIGDSLCRFITTLSSPKPDEIDVLAAHVDSLRLVIRDRIEGNGGAMGEQLLDGLRAAVAKVMG